MATSAWNPYEGAYATPTPSISGYTSPTLLSNYINPGGTIYPSAKSTYTTPQPYATTPQAQPIQQQPSGGGGGGGFQTTQYQPLQQTQQMLQMPQEPQVTAELIRQWQERAMQEASMIYDPQILAIQQELDKAILSANQTAGSIPGYYEDILSQIREWQDRETGAMQQRYFARGLGRGGGLIQEEEKLATTAGKQLTTAETEKARKLTDIEEQKQLLTEQAGAKTTGAKTAQGQYTASRAADLQDSYMSNKSALEQQRFQNQMAIQEFGLTAETQNFQNWLSSMELANDIWYKNSQVALEEESQRIEEMAKTGSGTRTTGTTGTTSKTGTAGTTNTGTTNFSTVYKPTVLTPSNQSSWEWWNRIQGNMTQ